MNIKFDFRKGSIDLNIDVILKNNDRYRVTNIWKDERDNFYRMYETGRIINGEFIESFGEIRPMIEDIKEIIIHK